jgi:hypothetical protein
LPEPEPQPVSPDTPTEALAATGQLLSPREKIDREMYLEPDELQKHAVKSLREMLKGIAIARSAATGAASSAVQLLMSMQPVLLKIKNEVERDLKENLGPNETENTLKNLKIINDVANTSASAMKNLIEAEKLALGQPTSIMGLISAPPAAPTQTPDAAAQAQKTLEALFSMGADPNQAPQAEYVPESGGTGEAQDKGEEK